MFLDEYRNLHNFKRRTSFNMMAHDLQGPMAFKHFNLMLHKANVTSIPKYVSKFHIRSAGSCRCFPFPYIDFPLIRLHKIIATQP